MTGPSGVDGGERVVMGGVLTHVQQQHLARYHWAAAQVHGTVLDVASGTGYGTAILNRAADAEGIEGSADAILHANATAPGVRFTQAVLPTIPRGDEAFDAVVCFETLEHIDEDTEFVAEMWRVLKRGGLLLLSTPNKDIDSPDGPPGNDFHFREYRLADLIRLVEVGGFEDLEVFGQCSERRGLLETSTQRLLARYPLLCRPGRWWDRIGHTDDRVERWDGERALKYWVIRAQKR